MSLKAVALALQNRPLFANHRCAMMTQGHALKHVSLFIYMAEQLGPLDGEKGVLPTGELTMDGRMMNAVIEIMCLKLQNVTLWPQQFTACIWKHMVGEIGRDRVCTSLKQLRSLDECIADFCACIVSTDDPVRLRFIQLFLLVTADCRLDDLDLATDMLLKEPKKPATHEELLSFVSTVMLANLVISE